MRYTWRKQPEKFAIAQPASQIALEIGPSWKHDPFSVPAVDDLLAAQAGDTNITITWHQAAGNEGYLLSWTKDAWATKTDVVIAQNTETYTLTGVTEIASYEFTVRTKLTQNSVIHYGTPLILAYRDIISRPTDLAVTINSTIQATLAWTGITGNDGYKVQYSSDAGTNWSAQISVAKDAVTKVITGLTPNTSYTFRIYTIRDTDGGLSLVSNLPVGVTKIASPVLTVGAIAATTAVINWTNITGNAGYTLFISADAGATWDAGTQITADLATKTVTGLTAETAYKFKAVTKRVASPTTSADSNIVDVLTIAA